TTVSDITFKHILLPIWTAVYKYRGKTFRFVVNGQTGTVKGQRPWSWVKITFAVIAGAIIAGVIGYILSQNQ
ncbi:MAG TPA: primosomal protein N' (replication factor Y) - superfamily II helicase, partial [Rhodobacteraceae bacterium]|nr:primosomal protein N' (replication factor Y) - superfamily II helicase [Paracoccaceae bacterium]